MAQKLLSPLDSSPAWVLDPRQITASLPAAEGVGRRPIGGPDGRELHAEKFQLDTLILGSKVQISAAEPPAVAGAAEHLAGDAEVVGSVPLNTGAPRVDESVERTEDSPLVAQEIGRNVGGVLTERSGDPGGHFNRLVRVVLEGT